MIFIQNSFPIHNLLREGIFCYMKCGLKTELDKTTIMH